MIGSFAGGLADGADLGRVRMEAKQLTVSALGLDFRRAPIGRSADTALSVALATANKPVANQHLRGLHLDEGRRDTFEQAARTAAAHT
jgi:hypothetical protein